MAKTYSRIATSHLDQLSQTALSLSNALRFAADFLDSFRVIIDELKRARVAMRSLGAVASLDSLVDSMPPDDSVRQLLERGEVIKFDLTTLWLRFSNSKDRIFADLSREALSKAVSDHYGAPINLRIK